MLSGGASSPAPISDNLLLSRAPARMTSMASFSAVTSAASVRSCSAASRSLSAAVDAARDGRFRPPLGPRGPPLELPTARVSNA